MADVRQPTVETAYKQLVELIGEPQATRIHVRVQDRLEYWIRHMPVDKAIEKGIAYNSEYYRLITKEAEEYLQGR